MARPEKMGLLRVDTYVAGCKRILYCSISPAKGRSVFYNSHAFRSLLGNMSEPVAFHLSACDCFLPASRASLVLQLIPAQPYDLASSGARPYPLIKLDLLYHTLKDLLHETRAILRLSFAFPLFTRFQGYVIIGPAMASSSLLASGSSTKQEKPLPR
jgi:hypothetical protein